MAYESGNHEINRLILSIERRLPALRARCSGWFQSEGSATSSSLREIEFSTLRHLRIFSRMLDTRVGPFGGEDAEALPPTQRVKDQNSGVTRRNRNSH